MGIKDTMVDAVNRLGGVHPTNIDLVQRAIASHISCLQRLLTIEAATARGDVRQLSFAPSYPSPPPPAELPNGVSLSLSAAINEVLFQRAQNLDRLPPATRAPRAKQSLSNLVKEVNIACVELNAMYGLVTSRPPPETRYSADRGARGLAGLPLSGVRAPQFPPSAAPWQTFTTARTSTDLWPGLRAEPDSQPQAAQYRLSYLPLNVLTLVIECLDTFADITSLCNMLPEARIAMRHVRALSLVGPDEIGPPPATLRGLHELRLAAPLRFDRTGFPVLPLDRVTLDQRAPGWTHDSSMYTISTLGLAAVRHVRLEWANPAVVIVFAALSRPATRLRVDFDGALTDVRLATATRLMRSFTRVEQVALPYIFQTARTDNLAHLAISNWLPGDWAGVLFAETPDSLVSLEIRLGGRPAFNAAHGELLSLLHCRGGRWAWCKYLRTLKLSSAVAGFEVDERDVRAFMASALGREVEVELRGVRYIGSGVA